MEAHTRAPLHDIIEHCVQNDRDDSSGARANTFRSCRVCTDATGELRPLVIGWRVKQEPDSGVQNEPRASQRLEPDARDSLTAFLTIRFKGSHKGPATLFNCVITALWGATGWMVPSNNHMQLQENGIRQGENRAHAHTHTRTMKPHTACTRAGANKLKAAGMLAAPRGLGELKERKP